MKPRVVYRTGSGRICPRCGWPAAECRCASVLAPDAPVPERITARLRVERRPSGKSVTVVDGLPGNGLFLDALARELKRACGTGGTAAESAIELQGDQRERVRELLAGKGWKVKG